MSDWSAADDARLVELWADPTLSTSAIGREIGRGKNSVIGRAHRLKLPRRRSPISVAPKPTPKPAPNAARKPERDRRHKAAPHRAVVASAPKYNAPAAQGAGSPHRACQWPVGREGRQWVMCGAPVLPGCSWCSPHRARAFVAREAASA